MKILIAPDKFKGSLTAYEVCNIIAKTIAQHLPEAQIMCQEMADGGEGSLEILMRLIPLTEIHTETKDPLFRAITSSYLLHEPSGTAYIEMSRASGLQLLQDHERHCMHTSSIGTGMLIKHAIDHKAKKIFLFIGGSATNDAGIGIAHALGFRFLNEMKQIIEPVGRNLIEIVSIKKPEDGILEKINLELISDVNNPMHGEHGAAFTYAAQKGATAKEILVLDRGLKQIDGLFKTQFNIAISDVPGAGAAGAAGAGGLALLGAKMSSGSQFIINATSLKSQITNVDVILTGEGKLDRQSLQGKVVQGVAALCKKMGKPCIVICGINELNPNELIDTGITHVISLSELAGSASDALSNVDKFLTIASEQAISLFLSSF